MTKRTPQELSKQIIETQRQIGMCVFNLDREGRTLECRYCGEPEERK